MLQYLESKLYADVEGTCSGQFGYIIAVVSILDIGKGMVLSGSGQAEFITRYRAIVFKPFKGEVVDGVVNNVNKVSAPSVTIYPQSDLQSRRWASLQMLALSLSLYHIKYASFLTAYSVPSLMYNVLLSCKAHPPRHEI